MKKLFRSRFVYCALVVCFIAAPALAAAVKAGSAERSKAVLLPDPVVESVVKSDVEGVYDEDTVTQ